MRETERVYDVNSHDLLYLNEIDLHDVVRTKAEPIPALPGLEIMADQGDSYATIRLDMQGVVKLRRYLQRLERRVRRESQADA